MKIRIKHPKNWISGVGMHKIDWLCKKSNWGYEHWWWHTLNLKRQFESSQLPNLIKTTRARNQRLNIGSQARNLKRPLKKYEFVFKFQNLIKKLRNCESSQYYR